MEICHLAVSLNQEMQLVACNMIQHMMNHSMETVILCMLTSVWYENSYQNMIISHVIVVFLLFNKWPRLILKEC